MKAEEQCQKWADVYEPQRFQAFAREKKHVVMKLCRSLRDIAQFLHVGRHRWDLTQWSKPFYTVEIDITLPEVLRCLNRLAEYEWCTWLEAAGLVHVRAIQTKLNLLRGQKMAMEKFIATAELERGIW